MEHTDFHKIFQTLLPIAIFILWALFSKSGKKRGKAAPVPRHERSDHDQSEGPSPAAEKSMPEHNTRSLEDLQPEVVTEPATDGAMKSHLAIQAGAYDLAISPIDNQKAYSTAIENIPTSESGTSFHTTQSGPSVAALQKYIIWSEILSRPVALRD